MQKEYYIKLRDQYKPDNLKVIFILESPPVSGKYFYDDNSKSDLFVVMMEIIKYKETSKHDGLRTFQKAGYFITDATYTPVNKMLEKERNLEILKNLFGLIDDLKKLTKDKKVKIILIKKNIYNLLVCPLKVLKFNVINKEYIPFPGSGHARECINKINKIL